MDRLNGAPKTAREASLMQPVALAFLGDTLFDLYLRSEIVNSSPKSPHQMHEDASRRARASAQAKMAQLLLPELSEEESAMLKRARNQKSISPPKNADPVDYKWATGFEAMLGFLYVCGREERLFELMARAVELFDSSAADLPQYEKSADSQEQKESAE